MEGVWKLGSSNAYSCASHNAPTMLLWLFSQQAYFLCFCRQPHFSLCCLFRSLYVSLWVIGLHNVFPSQLNKQINRSTSCLETPVNMTVYLQHNGLLSKTQMKPRP